MKKQLLSFALLVFLFAQTKGQTSVYHAFPDSNAVWNVNRWWEDFCGTPNNSNDDYSYIINGDTLIRGKQYHKVYIPYVESYGSCSATSPGFAGTFRQDTANRKVYYFDFYYKRDALLYDFNLQIGDAIPTINSCATVTVIGIDSILIGATYRKRWTLSAGLWVNYTMIEGIGFDADLFEYPCLSWSSSVPVYSTLICFSQDGITLYPDSTSACNVIESVNNIQPKEDFLSISPNPATNQLTIHPVGWSSNGVNTSSFQHEGVTVLVMNVLGQETLPPAPLLEERGEAVIDVSGLAAGMYFVELKTERGSVVRMFVKQ